MNLPDHVAVMSLPNAILFPRVLLPLYIFEPRYQQMLADCLHGERLFAVALRHSTGTPAPIAGVGMVRTSLTRPDGTSNLILEGVARVEILEYVQVKTYRIARVKPCASFTPTPPARAKLVQTVERLAKVRAKFGTEFPTAMLDLMLAVDEIDHLTDLVASALLDDCRTKQRLLETLNVTERLDRLVQLLHLQIREFEVMRKLQGDLPNEHVGRN